MAFSTAKLKKILDIPVFEVMKPLPGSSAAGSFLRSIYIPAFNIAAAIVALNATSSIYYYDSVADTEVLLPASGIAGTFGACACGRIHPMGPAGTATGGSSTAANTSLTITRDLRGKFIRITGGPGAGDLRKIASNTVGANSVITPTQAFSAPITAASTFQLLTPQLWVFNPSTTAPGFAVWDYATNAWTQKSVTNLATSWGTDAIMGFTPAINGNQSDSSDGKTFSCTTAALTVSAGMIMTTDQWRGGVLTVYEGTGAGQVAYIASNTSAGVLTFVTALGVVLDATSKWVLEKGFESAVDKGAITHGNTTNATIQRGTGTWHASTNFTRMQVRVIGGTGKGQVKAITSMTTTVLTLSGVWTTALAADSIWVIEGNDDDMYLVGNAATAAYRYSRSANSWTVLTARGSAAGVGCSCAWVYGVRDPVWTNADTYANRNGRYLYCFRGNSTALDIYDTALGTWTNGQVYGGSGETITTGWCYEYDDRDNIYIATHNQRVLRFDLIRWALEPSCETSFAQGTTVVGDKLALVPFFGDTGERLDHLYHWRNSGADLMRCAMWHTYGGN